MVSHVMIFTLWKTTSLAVLQVLSMGLSTWEYLLSIPFCTHISIQVPLFSHKLFKDNINYEVLICLLSP